MNGENSSDLTPKQKARQEGQRLLYDSFKHLTTLSSASVVLLATPLREILPKTNLSYASLFRVRPTDFLHDNGLPDNAGFVR
jgi:hypothetical protein